MMITVNETFKKKADEFKRPLIERDVFPVNIVEIVKDANSFQGLKAVKINDFKLPIKFDSGDKLLIDFGEHCVGYLNFSLNKATDSLIVDSPAKFKFSFGEFPLEIVKDDYKGTLGNGWLQREEKSIVFMPYNGSLERRYSFRYLLIERTDNARYSIEINELFAKCVSAVEIKDTFKTDDKLLDDIYDISIKTLRDCEQDVFEDGPKRDRRLWIGDLRLQALTDYYTFKNIDLVKRCLYLFAAYRPDNKVAPCVFPDSPPYVDSWNFADYSLFFISCLYDYMKNRDDISFIKELYPIALEQFKITSSLINGRKIEAFPFIDWCPDLNKSVSLWGVYIYTLKQLKEIALKINESVLEINSEIKKATEILLSFKNDDGLFETDDGQISYHSQIWAVLSGVLSEKENIDLLEKIKNTDTEFTMRTPYMIHYYIEALDFCGLKDEAISQIKDYWGKIIEKGFDCCPEIFNPENEFESPYSAPEINSACHAWSCTPAYWICKFYK